MTAWRLAAFLAAGLLACAPAARAASGKAAKKAPAKKFVPAVGSGVVVSLQNGSKVEGIYQGEGDGAVWLEVDGGEAGIERSTIVDIAPAKGGAAEYKRKAAAIVAGDAGAWWALAQWAEQNELHASAKSAAKSVIRIQPDHEAARKFLGFSKHDGKWYEGDDVHRAKGLVEWEGEWMTPQDLEAAKARAKKKAEDDAKEQNLRSMRLHSPRKYEAPQGRPFGGWVDSYGGSR